MTFKFLGISIFLASMGGGTGVPLLKKRSITIHTTFICFMLEKSEIGKAGL